MENNISAESRFLINLEKVRLSQYFPTPLSSEVVEKTVAQYVQLLLNNGIQHFTTIISKLRILGLDKVSVSKPKNPSSMYEIGFKYKNTEFTLEA